MPKQEKTKKPPISAFGTGKFKPNISTLTSKKDKRNQLVVEGLQQGIIVAWIKKHNVDEEAFIGPDIRYLTDNMEVMENLGIGAIFARRGIDGETPMKQNPKSTYQWKQFVFLVGESGNTQENRSKLATNLAVHFNTNEHTIAEYKYPRKTKFLKDITREPPRSVDACFLDSDVLKLMSAAFPTWELDEIAVYDNIVSGFFTNMEHGKRMIENADIDFGDN